MKVLMFLLLSSVCLAQGESQPQFLTNEASARDYWPGFSADGKTIIFSRQEKGGKWKLFQVAVSGGEPTVFWEGQVGATRVNISSGGLIAFTGITPNENATLWITEQTGKNSRKVNLRNNTGNAFYPSWFSNQKQVIMVDYQGEKGGNLISVDLLSGEAKMITNPAEIRCGMPSISPTGNDIVFAGQKPDGNEKYDQTKNAIWLLDKNKSLRQLSPGQGRAPIWSPDGKWIAYESTEGIPDGKYAIFIISADGQQHRRLCSYEWGANHPVWSPNGKTLVISAVRPGSGTETRIALLQVR